MRRKLKGSLTIEAAIVVSICLLFIGSGIMRAYDVFNESISCMQKEAKDIDSVKLFYTTKILKQGE